jgi:hypothetical protein
MCELIRMVFPRFAKHADQVLEFQPRLGIESGGGFVENQELRIIEQRARQAQALRLALGEPIHRPIRQRGEVGELRDFGHTALEVDAAQAIGARKKIQVVAHGRVPIRDKMIRHPADAATDFIGILHNVDTAQPHRSAVRQIERGQDPHRRGFARAVRTDQADHLAGRKFEGHAVHGFHAAEPAREAVNLEKWRGIGHWPPFAAAGAADRLDAPGRSTNPA